MCGECQKRGNEQQLTGAEQPVIKETIGFGRGSSGTFHLSLPIFFLYSGPSSPRPGGGAPGAASVMILRSEGPKENDVS